MMSKKTSTLLLLFGALLLIAFWMLGQYNGLVNADADVAESWSNVQTQYQRRADLVPQLIATVRGAADFEASTFEEVTRARTEWLNSGSMDAAQDFDSAFSRLLVSVEAYPELKANQGFLSLQNQLEGTENRIAVSRDDYNAEVTRFNKMTRRVPINIFASMFGFEAYDLFSADIEAEKAPEVEFDFQ